MANRTFDTRSSEWLGDMTVWLRDNANTNSELLTRLRQNLRRARQQELTPRQQQVLTLYYDQGMNMTPDCADSGRQLLYGVQNHSEGQAAALPLPALLSLICTFFS